MAVQDRQIYDIVAEESREGGRPKRMEEHRRCKIECGEFIEKEHGVGLTHIGDIRGPPS